MYKHDSDDSMLSIQKPNGPSAMYQQQNDDSMMSQRKVEIPSVSMQPEFAMLLPNDPLSPMSWPLWKKVFTSLASFMAVFTILYATTTLSVAVPALPMALHTSTRLANLAFSIPFFGVTLAPIYTPHVTERFGRKPVYLVSFFLFSFVVLGGSFAKTIGQVLAIRFTAGLCAGPCAVLIEGTFADIWSANKTVSYYVFIALSQELGAAFGQVIGSFVLHNKGNVSWLSYVALFFCAVTFPMLVYMPETYAREILRQKNKKCPGLPLAPALSGVTLGQMATHTLINPLKMFFFEPLVIMCTLYLGLNFALVFQWFITVPFVLSHVYNFSGTSVGLAFLSAIIGSIIAAVLSLVLDIVPKRDPHGMAKIETRMYPAMLGSALIVVALFWVGWSADPTTHSIVPITGTGVFVCGNMMILVSPIAMKVRGK
jgi:MFS family permease